MYYEMHCFCDSCISLDRLRFEQQQQQHPQQVPQLPVRAPKRMRVESVHFDSEDACSSETFLLMQQRVSAPITPPQETSETTAVSPPQMPPQPSSK